jgi:hypothetical protein
VTTTGTYSFNVTRDDIVREAMINVGKLDPDESPTPRESTDCVLKLNLIVKQWMGKTDFAPGLKTWTRRRSALFLSNATGQYSVGPVATGWATTYARTTTTAPTAGGGGSVTLAATAGVVIGYNIGIQLASGNLFWTTVSNLVGSVASLTAAIPVASSVASGAVVYAYQTAAQQPIDLEAVVLRDQNNEDVPMKIMIQEEYDALPSKTDLSNTSDPTAIYLEYQLGNSNLFLDVAAAFDVTKYLVVTYLESIQDITNPLDNPEFPPEYFQPLCWELAKQIAPMFRAVWTKDMEDDYKTAISLAKGKDPEVSRMYFQSGSED